LCVKFKIKWEDTAVTDAETTEKVNDANNSIILHKHTLHTLP